MTAFPRKQAPFDFKTQYSLPFTAQDQRIVVDFFCGAGGGSTGLEEGRRAFELAVRSHSPCSL